MTEEMAKSLPSNWSISLVSRAILFAKDIEENNYDRSNKMFAYMVLRQELEDGGAPCGKN